LKNILQEMRKITLVLLLMGLSAVSQAQRSFDIQISSTQPALLMASAGEEPTLIGSDLVLGDSPAGLGGIEPYTYQWLPVDNLDNSTIANPVFSGGSSTEYTLLITDSRGCLATDTIQILITGAGNASTENVLKAYPNPGSGKIRIVAPENLKLSKTMLQVFDAAGKIVYSAHWENVKNEILVDVSKLSNGQYTLMLSDGIVSVSNKIIIQ